MTHFTPLALILALPAHAFIQDFDILFVMDFFALILNPQKTALKHDLSWLLSLGASP